MSYTHYIAGATRVERLVNPAEIRLGIQANVPKFPAISIGAAWQLMMNDGGNNRYKMEFYVQAFNALNRANLQGFVGNLRSEFYGEATSAAAARRIEVGLNFGF